MNSPQANITEIVRSMKLFVGPGQLGECRFFDQRTEDKKGGSGFFFRYEEIDQAAGFAVRMNHSLGAYLVMNEIGPAILDGRKTLEIVYSLTKNENITRRRKLLIDFDPSSPARGSSDSATDNEKAAAFELREVVSEYLRGHDFPEAVFADSGNGSHLLFEVDLPNDEASNQLVESFLKALAKRFSTDQVGVDISVHNAGRVTKLYGSVARKGKDRPDRPHRLSTIQSVPDCADGIVTRDMIEAVVSELSGCSLLDGRSQTTGHTDHDLIADFDATPAKKLLLPESFPDGSRHDTLLKIAGAVRSFGANETEIGEILRVFNRTRCGNGKPDDELQKIARDFAVKDCNLTMKTLIESDDHLKLEAAERQQKLKQSLEFATKRLSSGDDAGEIILKLQATIEQLKPDDQSPMGVSAGDLLDSFNEMRPAIIEETLRIGETMNIIAAPKCGKSWLALQLALCVVCGLKWLGRFWTKQGRVLIIDNELHKNTSSARLAAVASAMGIKREQYEGLLIIWNVRGQLLDLEKLCVRLSRLNPGQYDLIVFDAFYRFIPKGLDENSNADMTYMYNLLDAALDRLRCAGVCIHHTSKGSQSSKSVTDTGSGAGAQSRAADTHLVLRPHEEEGAVVVDAVHRSFKPMDAFCMRLKFPLWELADDLDPKDLRQERPRKAKGITDESGQSPADLQQQRDAEARQKLLDAYATFPAGETARILRESAGMSGTAFGPVNSALVRSGIVEACTVQKNHSGYPGFRLVASTVGQLGQTGQTSICPTCPTEGGECGGTAAPPLGGGVSPTPTTEVDRKTKTLVPPASQSHLTGIDHALASELIPVEAA